MAASKFGVGGTAEEVEAANTIIGLYRIRMARRRLREVLTKVSRVGGCVVASGRGLRVASRVWW